MKIYIEKFKFHNEPTEFTFLEGELNLMKGPSGCGKTTIFEAIYWVLYGSKKVVYPKTEKVSPKKPTIVKIIMDSGLVITRSKPPDFLEVNLPTGGFIEDETAQEWIVQFFGTKQAFLATTYMRQKRESPLLELKSSDKTVLLQELTFGVSNDGETREEPKFYSDQINDKLKEVKREVITFRGRTAVLKEQYEQAKLNCVKASRIWGDENERPNDQILEDMELDIEDDEKEIFTLKSDVKSGRKAYDEYKFYIEMEKKFKANYEAADLKSLELMFSPDDLLSTIRDVTAWDEYCEKKESVHKIKPSEDVCTFFDENLEDVELIKKHIQEVETYQKACKGAKIDPELAPDEMVELIAEKVLSIQNKLSESSRTDLIVKEFNASMKTHLLSVKSLENWKKKIVSERKNIESAWKARVASKHASRKAAADAKKAKALAEIETKIAKRNSKIKAKKAREASIKKAKAVSEKALINARESWEKSEANSKKVEDKMTELKQLYDEYYKHQDVTDFVNAAGIREDDDTNKASISKYYNREVGFSKITDIFKKIIFESEITDSALVCPSCDTRLEMKRVKRVSTLHECDPLKKIDPLLKESAEKGIINVMKLESYLKAYRSAKKTYDELEEYEEFDANDYKYVEEEYEDSSEEVSDEEIEEYVEVEEEYSDDEECPEYVQEEDEPEVIKAPEPLDLDEEELSPEVVKSLKKEIQFLQRIEIPKAIMDNFYPDETLISMMKSLLKYTKYTDAKTKFDAIEVPEHVTSSYDLNTLEKMLNEILAADLELKNAKKKLKELKAVEKPTIDVEALESEIAKLEARIKSDTKLVNAGYRLIELQKFKDNLDKDVQLMNDKITHQTNLDKIKQIIGETSSHALDETIDIINSILSQIVNVLYDNDTRITLSMFKKLKTRDHVKAEPNIQITQGFGDKAISFSSDEVSGGEGSRLTLALMLSLSTIGTSPFVFIDEGLSSLNRELREKCLEIVREYTPNKTVINVCHGIVEGFHDLIVEVAEETD
jgi:DNA repair exonuclease SbcCD ATPase subunit